MLIYHWRPHEHVFRLEFPYGQRSYFHLWRFPQKGSLATANKKKYFLASREKIYFTLWFHDGWSHQNLPPQKYVSTIGIRLTNNYPISTRKINIFFFIFHSSIHEIFIETVHFSSVRKSPCFTGIFLYFEINWCLIFEGRDF